MTRQIVNLRTELDTTKVNERPAPSDALVVFGVTGDLAHKMIFPALYAMVKNGELTAPVIGVAFPQLTVAASPRARDR